MSRDERQPLGAPPSSSVPYNPAQLPRSRVYGDAHRHDNTSTSFQRSHRANTQGGRRQGGRAVDNQRQGSDALGVGDAYNRQVNSNSNYHDVYAEHGFSAQHVDPDPQTRELVIDFATRLTVTSRSHYVLDESTGQIVRADELAARTQDVVDDDTTSVEEQELGSEDERELQRQVEQWDNDERLVPDDVSSNASLEDVARAMRPPMPSLSGLTRKARQRRQRALRRYEQRQNRNNERMEHEMEHDDVQGLDGRQQPDAEQPLEPPAGPTPVTARPLTQAQMRSLQYALEPQVGTIMRLMDVSDAHRLIREVDYVRRFVLLWEGKASYAERHPSVACEFRNDLLRLLENGLHVHNFAYKPTRADKSTYVLEMILKFNDASQEEQKSNEATRVSPKDCTADTLQTLAHDFLCMEAKWDTLPQSMPQDAMRMRYDDARLARVQVRLKSMRMYWAPRHQAN